MASNPIDSQKVDLAPGEDVTLTFTFSGGAPDGLDGMAFAFYVRTATDATPSNTYTTAGGAISASSSAVTVVIPAADTTIWTTDRTWDLWRTDAGNSKRVARGTFEPSFPARP